MKEKRIHILLVEDSETHAAMIRASLESGPVPVELRVVKSLFEARAALSLFLPDLAIVDLFLPDGRGTELLPGDKEEILYPVVIMTAWGDEGAAVEAMRAGALDYVVKSPATLADIPRTVERALREWGHILESRRAREELVAANRRLRVEMASRKKTELERDRLFERSMDMFAIAEINGCFRQVNPAWTETLGWSEEELVGHPYDAFVHPDDLEATAAAVERLQSGENLTGFENRYRCKNGSFKWISWNSLSLPEEGVTFSVARDITERKNAEEELQRNEVRIKAIYNNIAAGIAVTDSEGRLIEINDRWAEMFGYAREEMIGKHPETLTRLEDRDESRRRLDSLLKGEVDSYRHEKRYVRKDGSAFWADLSVTTMADGEGRLEATAGVIFDITDRKKAVEELKEANRELDAFAHTVSHDLRTPLTPIIGYAQFLREAYSESLDEQARGCLREIERSGQKMLALMEDLLCLATVGHVERPAEPVDTREVVGEVAEALGAPLAAAGVSVRIGFMPALHVPESLLAQLFDNLIGNAVHYAASEGGPVEVGGEREGERVRYYVRDHGPGIPEEERGRIFDVFYRGSTGEKIAGTGVGLATVQKIARLYEGRAWVEETPGGGATFWVEMEDGGPSEAMEEEKFFASESAVRLSQGGSF